MKDPLETAEQSACLRFAREFLPVVNEALADVHLQQPGAAGAVDIEPAEGVAANAAAETATGEPAADSSGLFGGEQAGPGEQPSVAAPTKEEPAAGE